MEVKNKMAEVKKKEASEKKSKEAQFFKEEKKDNVKKQFVSPEIEEPLPKKKK